MRNEILQHMFQLAIEIASNNVEYPKDGGLMPIIAIKCVCLGSILAHMNNKAKGILREIPLVEL